MDSYVTNTGYDKSHTYYVNFNYEVLNGCNYACTGCAVDIEGQDKFTTEEAVKFQWLLSDMSKDMYQPFIAFIGPTDFLVSKNTVEFLSNPEVIKMLQKYRRLSFITTYLSQANIDEVALVLNKHYSNMELEINTVIQPEKIYSEGYLSVIKKNMALVKEKLHKFDRIRNFALFNVFEDGASRFKDALKDYNRMDEVIGDNFDTTIDFIFSFGRRNELDASYFKERCYQIADLFDEAVAKDNQIRFSFGKLTDSLVERQYNYRNGKFYYSPMLYERYVGFEPELEIPVVEWVSEEFEEYEDQVLDEAFDTLENKEECGECQYMSMCMERGIHKLMDIYEGRQCLVAREALDVING